MAGWALKIYGLPVALKTNQHSAAAGTYDFQAPECLMGKKIGFAADVFSFGVLLLEICTKERQRRGFYIFPE